MEYIYKNKDLFWFVCIVTYKCNRISEKGDAMIYWYSMTYKFMVTNMITEYPISVLVPCMILLLVTHKWSCNWKKEISHTLHILKGDDQEVLATIMDVLILVGIPLFHLFIFETFFGVQMSHNGQYKYKLVVEGFEPETYYTHPRSLNH